MITLRIRSPLKEKIRIITKDRVDVTTNVDYDRLKNKPSINSVILQGNKEFEDLGIQYVTNLEIDEILKGGLA